MFPQNVENMRCHLNTLSLVTHVTQEAGNAQSKMREDQVFLVLILFFMFPLQPLLRYTSRNNSRPNDTTASNNGYGQKTGLMIFTILPSHTFSNSHAPIPEMMLHLKKENFVKNMFFCLVSRSSRRWSRDGCICSPLSTRE